MTDVPFLAKWEDIVFSSKKKLNTLNATFIAAPREMSQKRLVEIVKTYLPQGNIILGIANESYVAGFEYQPQFKTLQLTDVLPVIQKIWSSSAKNKVYILSYNQKDTQYIYEKVNFKKVVLVNGSWKFAYHTQKPFYALVSRNIPFEYISPFSNEDEAKEYANRHESALKVALPNTTLTDQEMFQLIETVSRASYDYMFQAGLVLAEKTASKAEEAIYKPLLAVHNQVVPYETYAMHHGAAREKHFSPPNDLNHYDTVHAESALPVHALEQNVRLENTVLFINLLPCPTCSRMLAITPITEIVYQIDHSDGYAIKLLEAAGKTVRRAVF